MRKPLEELTGIFSEHLRTISLCKPPTRRDHKTSMVVFEPFSTDSEEWIDLDILTPNVSHRLTNDIGSGDQLRCRSR